MVLLLLAALNVAAWVPARWVSDDPASLALLKETPINCLLVEQARWSGDFAANAAAREVAVLGVIRPGTPPGATGKAKSLGLAGVVLEGDFDADTANRLREEAEAQGLAVVELAPRRKLDFERKIAARGTYQAVWPGIEEPKEGEHKAGPTGAPWIFTNGGFLRYAVAVSRGPFWIAQTPPEDREVTTAGYIQAVGDAAMVGARWVLALQPSYWERIRKNDPEYAAGWRKIAETLAFYEKQKEWGRIRPLSQLAVVQDGRSGALYAGGILDMLATKHYPLNIIPPARLSEQALVGTRIVVNVDAQSLSEEQAAALKDYARRGGTVFTGPPQAKLPPLEGDQIQVDEEDLKKIDGLWNGVNNMLWQENVGARLFNVSGMLSSLLELGEGPVILHLVNYTEYPVENIVAAVKGKYSKAMLYQPNQPPRELELFEGRGGSTEAEIEQVDVVATIRFE